MRITKTKYFKASKCRIEDIVGDEKQNELRTEDSIEVTEEEFEQINKKNPTWFIVDSEEE